MGGVWRRCGWLTESSVVLSVLLMGAVVAAFMVPVGTRSAASAAPRPSADATAMASRGVVGHGDPDAVPPVTQPSTPATTAVPPTTVAPPPTTTSPAPPTTSAPRSNTPVAFSSAGASDYGCAAALAYLRAHAAPGFTLECPGYAEGHQAMTCDNVAGVCAGTKVIAIAVPCRAAYMNEASNSWVIEGESHAPIDPYGYCH